MSTALRAENLSYAYPQHGLGLETIDFVAESAETWVITGRSGCGKSTLARCLTGLIPHLYRGQMGGRVLVGDLDTQRTPLWQLGEQVGMVFQNPCAQSLASSVEEEILFGLENLGLSRAEMRGRLEASLERFGLSDLRHRLPSTLSGGEVQRLMLAAVLARRPGALVLDEPLSMLDTTAATRLVAHLGDLTRFGTTVVAFEHRAEYFESLPAICQFRMPNGGGDGLLLDDLPPAPLAAVDRVSLSNLSLRFGRRELFRGLNLEFRGGEVAALVGCNGVGKTTLFRALVGLQPYGGRIETANGGRPSFGLMFQNPDWQLFNPTVRQEILYRVDDPDSELYAWLLAALSLARYEDVPPLLLSEGEKKRLALAVLLLRKPHHGVLLDEPTLGQDDAHGAILGRAARGLARAGNIVVIATHDLHWALQYVDRLVLLAPGRVVADGPTLAVLNDKAAWSQAGLVVPEWLLAEAVS